MRYNYCYYLMLEANTMILLFLAKWCGTVRVVWCVGVWWCGVVRCGGVVVASVMF